MGKEKRGRGGYIMEGVGGERGVVLKEVGSKER